jgi:hypothetical protein
LPVAPLTPPTPIIVQAQVPRWAWVTTLVAVTTLVVAVVPIAQTLILNRSSLDVRGARVVEIEARPDGHDLVLAANLRNLGGMSATIYQAGVRATGSPFWPATSFKANTDAWKLPSNSPAQPSDKFSAFTKEFNQLKDAGFGVATIVDLSPSHAMGALAVPVRLEARDVHPTPLYVRLRVEASSLEALRQLAQERREAVWIDLYDEEDRIQTITVWDCRQTRVACSGALFDHR